MEFLRVGPQRNSLFIPFYRGHQMVLFIRPNSLRPQLCIIQVPINAGIADEIESYLRARIRHRLPVSPDVAFIWNSVGGGRAYNGPGLQKCLRPLLQQCGILNFKGKLPRIHDFRHSFAVNALLRWYRMGVAVDAKLPFLATYMGHSSAASTHHYLHFIEPLRTAASKRFASHYGDLVAPLQTAKGRR